MRWDVEGQSRIGEAAEGGRADVVWGEMCAKVASGKGDVDVVC